MCRWLLYVSTTTHPVAPALLLYHADHGLILQSEDATVYTPGLQRDSKHALRNHNVNVHGGGLGWYPEHTTSDKKLPFAGRLKTKLEIDERQ